MYTGKPARVLARINMFRHNAAGKSFQTTLAYMVYARVYVYTYIIVKSSIDRADEFRLMFTR